MPDPTCGTSGTSVTARCSTMTGRSATSTARRRRPEHCGRPALPRDRARCRAACSRRSNSAASQSPSSTRRACTDSAEPKTRRPGPAAADERRHRSCLDLVTRSKHGLTADSRLADLTFKKKDGFTRAPQRIGDSAPTRTGRITASSPTAWMPAAGLCADADARAAGYPAVRADAGQHR